MKRSKKPKLSKRDPYARELERGIYRQRRLNSTKVYNRKKLREEA